jgi:hypothetical protein
MNPSARLHKLAALVERLGDPGGCSFPYTDRAILVHRSGEPPPPPCPQCGRWHVPLVEEVVVHSRAHLEQLRRERGDAWIDRPPSGPSFVVELPAAPPPGRAEPSPWRTGWSGCGDWSGRWAGAAARTTWGSGSGPSASPACRRRRTGRATCAAKFTARAGELARAVHAEAKRLTVPGGLGKEVRVALRADPESPWDRAVMTLLVQRRGAAR